MAILQSRRRLSKPRTDAVGGMMGVGLLGGAANVIMQLARPGVGYGVMESRVESGRIDRHPIKRTRTTFTYLAVAAQGTPEQQAAFRRAVNGAHAQVYSTDESPVSYNAFDPDLQMWVGACMYKGVVDVYKLFVGEVDDAVSKQLFEEGITLGTMLQVPREKWPVDQAAFERYWAESVEKVHIDDAIREYLWPIAAGRVRGVKLPRAGAAQARRLQPGDHRGLPTAAVPRRDATGLGRRQAASLRPVDQAHSDREQRPASGPSGVSVQLDAEGSRLAHPDRTPARLGRCAAAQRLVRIHLYTGLMRSDNDTWDITTSVGATALFVAASRALEANKPDPLVVDPYAEMFCRAVGGEWADVLDGKAPENKLVSEFGHHFVNYQAARTKFFDTYFYGAADAGVRQIVIPAAGLDSRAYRLAWPTGTVVYELDQPQVLEFKGDVLRRSGESPTAERREIAVDLRDDWQGALLGSGFDPASPSAWLVEGLLVYLPASAQGELFAGINQLAAPAQPRRRRRRKTVQRGALPGGA